ncbi:ADP-ribosylglycohydrolase family protein [Sphingomonas alpina]|uniref:ADP-ribosylglycohydrolase family protein n=1 Tax=Sphingomonas alpina TaxID=653931 RepID=UPI001E561569|nr:ADP-ribosylglycohydrolase family protein [Sphingomonas alpina]
MPPKPSDAAADRAIGALLGLAVGDALGTTLEFSARDSLPLLVDMVGGGPFQLVPGQWTDDTAMALALGHSLIGRDEFDPRNCMARFVNWYRWGMYSCTGTCFDIGVTTRIALQSFEENGDPFAGSSDPKSAGNGSLMRLSPVAIWGARRDEAAILEVARAQSRLTHGAAECLVACESFAVLTARAIRGVAPEELFAAPLVTTPPSQSIEDILAGSWRGKPRHAIRSSGYVVDSLEAALWCVHETTSFEEAVLLAANLGDDADTVAAITGQLAGAIHGASAIPPHWRERLAWREEIKDLALKLYNGDSAIPA